MYGGKSWSKFRHLQPLSTKYNTASTSSRFSHLLQFPARRNNGSIIAHWLSLKSLAYLRHSFLCIMLSLYYIFSYWYSFLFFIFDFCRSDSQTYNPFVKYIICAIVLRFLNCHGYLCYVALITNKL